MLQAGEVAEFRRNITGQRVSKQFQQFQPGQTGQFRRNPAGQLV